MGPMARVAWTVAMSRLIATARRRLPAISPRRVRRTGWSMAQVHPLSTAPAATCQSSSRPVWARAKSTAAVTVSTAKLIASSRLRSRRAARTPTGAPSSMEGRVRAKSITVTRNGEPVSWNV